MAMSRLAALPGKLWRYAIRLWQHGLPAAREHNVSIFRIMREQLSLMIENELGPEEYYFYGLADPGIPWSEKRSYIGRSLLHKHWYVFTPRKYQFCIDNKLILARLLEASGLPAPELLAVYDPHWGYTRAGRPLRTAEDIAAWAEREDPDGVVFKPMESAQAKMVLVMEGRKPDSSTFVHISGKEYSPEQLVAHFNDPKLLADAYPGSSSPPRTMLAQERLRQHAALREFAEKTLSCVRVNTLTTLDGRVEILFAVLKLQPKDLGFDTPRAGGVICYIDTDTGRLGPGRLKRDPGHLRRTCLPDTGKEFTGFQLPMWEQVLDLARSAARAFPHAHAIGWDIGMSTRGPVIVEGNVTWGDFQVQCLRGHKQGSYKEVLEQLEQRAAAAGRQHH
ncbi:MAG: sugar-transfer associated ATP-grasp domain-containing protein [Candidatus Brocadiia bacterium]